MQWSAKSFRSCQSGTRVGRQGAVEMSEDNSIWSMSREGTGVSGKGQGREGGQKQKRKGRWFLQMGCSISCPSIPQQPLLPSQFQPLLNGGGIGVWSLGFGFAFPTHIGLSSLVFVVFCFVF